MALTTTSTSSICAWGASTSALVAYTAHDPCQALAAGSPLGRSAGILVASAFKHGDAGHTGFSKHPVPERRPTKPLLSAFSIQYPSIQTLRLLRLKLVAEGDAQQSTARGIVKM